MQLNIQILVAVVLIGILCFIIQKIRKRNLEIRYALSWLGVIIVLLFFDIFPQTMEWLANIFGIQIPANGLFTMGFCFFILIVLSSTIAISKLSNKNKVLIQEVALLKRRLSLLEDEIKK